MSLSLDLTQKMAGRGRGRGALKLLNLNRPGVKANDNLSSTLDSKDASRDLEKIISELRGLNFEVKDEQLQEIHRHVEMYSVSAERLESICKFLYSRCQQDHKIASVLARVADDLFSVEVDGKKFRGTLLQLVQADYKNKDDIFNDSPEKFVGVVSFLCQLFSITRIGGQPMSPLIIPIYEYLHMLLSTKSTEKMMEAFSLQIASVGAILAESDSEKMQDLMVKVRSRIISSKSNEKCRCLLLEALELFNNRWKTLDPNISAFYGETLANASDS